MPLKLRTVVTALIFFDITPKELDIISKEVIYDKSIKIENLIQTLKPH